MRREALSSPPHEMRLGKDAAARADRGDQREYASGAQRIASISESRNPSRELAADSPAAGSSRSDLTIAVHHLFESSIDSKIVGNACAW